MTASTPDAAKLLGYLTFVEFAEHGIVGGYLLVNQQARPVEFHCSAPLRPNRAQEILYGPTLRPYLYNEQIGQTLVRQSPHAAQVILTDEELALGLRELLDVPVVLLPDTGNSDLETQAERPTAAGVPFHVDGLPYHVDGLRLKTLAGFDSDQPLVAARLRQLASGWDFREPLGRIREAIQEAQRAAA